MTNSFTVLRKEEKYKNKWHVPTTPTKVVKYKK